MVNAKFPEKLAFLFEPHRYKIAYGGRGGTKSWGFARALLIQGIAKKLRILCAREIQKSIKDSVHKLLSDQIELLDVGAHYEVLENIIRGINGTEIIFVGLSTQSVESIKSYEGYDVCWVEEAHVVRKRSWDILIPTIRKEGSEIWISFNPELETDPTYQRFIAYPPDDAVIVFLTYKDNPWFSQVLEKERLHCKRYDPKGYEHIWEGKCKPAVEGAIYYEEIQTVNTENRICNVPYDPMLKVHVVLDLGWDDSLAAGLVQKNASEIRVIEYIEVSHTKIDIFSANLKTRPYNWGKVWLPHDGFSGSLNSGGKSTYDIMRALGWKVVKRKEIVELSLEEGIRNARLMFGRVYFDKAKCDAKESPGSIMQGFNPTDLHWRLIECLKRYRRHINVNTQAAMGPVKDDFTHGADMFRYICANIDKMTNDTDRVFIPSGVSYRPRDSVIGI
jgi:phage terminase large subunit